MLRDSMSSVLCYVAVKAACYILRDSNSGVLYFTWQQEQRVIFYVTVRASCYMLRGSMSSVLFLRGSNSSVLYFT